MDQQRKVRQGVIDAPPREYYGWIKARTCCICGGYGTHADPIEAAHFVGLLHPKTMKPAKRSHKGIAGWAAVPMHRSCHGEFDGTGQSFARENNWLHLYFAMQLVQWWIHERREGNGEKE